MIQGKIEILKELTEGHFYKFKITNKNDQSFEEVFFEYLGENDYKNHIFLHKKKKLMIELWSNTLMTEDDDYEYEILDTSVYKYWQLEQQGEGTNFTLTVKYPEVSYSTTVNIGDYIKELDKRRSGK